LPKKGENRITRKGIKSFVSEEKQFKSRDNFRTYLWLEKGK
jgi:hypothetical protein